MPSAILRPVGSVTEGWNPAVGTNWQLCGDASDATYVATHVDWGDEVEDTYEVANLPAEAVAVASVAVTWRYASTYAAYGAATSKPGWALGGTVLYGTTQNHPSLAQGVFQATDSVIARPGGGAWTVADVNAARLRMKNVTIPFTAGEARVQDIWFVVVYTVAPSGKASGRTKGSVIRTLGRVRVGD